MNNEEEKLCRIQNTLTDIWGGCSYLLLLRLPGRAPSCVVRAEKAMLRQAGDHRAQLHSHLPCRLVLTSSQHITCMFTARAGSDFNIQCYTCHLISWYVSWVTLFLFKMRPAAHTFNVAGIRLHIISHFLEKIRITESCWMSAVVLYPVSSPSNQQPPDMKWVSYESLINSLIH